MTKEFYHGTSTASGLECGNWLDPSKSAFEMCVWGTADLSIAKYWASSKAATDGSDGIIFTIELKTDKILFVDEHLLDETETLIERALIDGYEAIVFDIGEDCVSTIAVLNDRAARASR